MTHVVRKANINRSLMLMTFILLLAAALRITGLVRQPLWLDEIFTTTFASSLGADTLVHIMVSDVHPSAYYAQLNLWMRVAGTEDFSVRLNSVLWGLVAVASLYAVSVRRVGRPVALIAALLLAVSAFAVFYSKEARMYPMVMTLGLWVWYWLNEFLTQPLTVRVRITYCTITLLFLYSHGLALLMLPAIATYAVWWAFMSWRNGQPAWHERFGQWLQWMILIVLMYTPWLFLASNMGVNITHVPSLDVMANAAGEFLLGYGTPYPANAGYALLVMMTLVILMSMLGKPLRPVIVAFLLMPIAASIIISMILRPVWLTRTLGFTLPFLLLALAYVLERGGQALRRAHRWAGALPALVVAGALLSATLYQAATHRYDWTLDTARDYVVERVQPNDTILFPSESLFWLWSWTFVELGQIRPRITTEVVTPADVHVTHFAKRPLSVLFKPGQTYWVIWAQEFDAPDLSACEASFSEDEAVKVVPTWVRRVVVKTDAVEPVCG